MILNEIIGKRRSSRGLKDQQELMKKLANVVKIGPCYVVPSTVPLREKSYLMKDHLGLAMVVKLTPTDSDEIY